MKKILLLATGGTIASIEGNEGLVPGMTAEELLVHFEGDSQSVDVTCEILMNRDSTNMQPEHWKVIAEAISENYDLYDGFVITHGTDTMGYTSAALSYMLQGLEKPVVITGSQVPISFKQTDAKKNVADSIHFATEDIGGVFVVFDGRVIIGTRAVKMRTKSYDAFESINHPYVASIQNKKIEYYWKPKKSSEPFKKDTSLCSDVFLLKLHPGTKPEIFDYLKNNYKGIVIESFGNGGLPFEDRNLLPKLAEMVEAGVAVVISTQCLEEGQDLYLYEVGRKVAQYNVILSADMNTEAIIAKLMWVLGKADNVEAAKQWMEKPIAWDLSVDWEK
ncbi:asparaginase [Niallia taxi]|uniref:asparaginase n=1 Tax=Niallia taxi TaxID=2499688 RepID=A0A437KGE0_9BACI|nr:asparaginase [Niallia taxi]MCM3217802.1 asparaginase [Niallia taxi]MCT2343003.1 asparaginase [Niallia taxi]MDK8638886.1 asparaginase [Niallia taxi]MED3964522.1 asparaginase [Niallia taxi]MED4036692.1 asparaginase [Niallia taxi]